MIFVFVIGILQTVILVQNARISIITRKIKLKRYVDTGVKNYTSGRYGSQSSESSIIGYVLSGKIPEIVNELVSEIAKVTPVSNLSRELRYMEPQYSSQHMRNLDNQEITIHHLFFDFSH